MKIFIIGLPGSGKSTIGKKLAERLEMPFLDLDEVIEHQVNQPIRDVFAQQGEKAFRKLEQRVLHEVIEQHGRFVLATGGGAPCFYDNLEVMNRAGTTLFLDVPVTTIVERMQGEQITDRPLLHGLDQDRLVEEYTAKFEKRLPVYQQAHFVINQHTSVDEIVALLDIKS